MLTTWKSTESCIDMIKGCLLMMLRGCAALLQILADDTAPWLTFETLPHLSGLQQHTDMNTQSVSRAHMPSS